MNKKFLSYFFLLGTILGICPRNEQHICRKRGKKTHHFKIYTSFIILLMLWQFAYFVWLVLGDYYVEGLFIKFLIELLDVAVLTMDITLTIFFINFTQHKKWKSMNKYLNVVENQLISYCASIDSGILGHVYIDICFITVIITITNASMLWIFCSHSRCFFFLHIQKVYGCYMIVLVYLIVTRIRNGLTKLHAFLEGLTPSKIGEEDSNVKFIQPYNSYSEFMKCYRIIYDVVQFFNDIFGYHMVFLNLFCILEWLSVLNLIISSIKYNSMEIDVITVMFINIIIILIGIIFIILLCASVTSKAEHFLYVLHQIEDDNHNLKAKSIVIQLVEDMPLHFSAARFFNISKYTILGLIGNCTTYFIVLIQFYQ
ncbi:uncharacterized protein LOC123676012 isoform X1 [Harmonia axyridis]|uniref:uncharacterized protein LOC123676012 isoform X1 n=1 Tax=Harmonia axyridis TaxID=115357 RepID=UPI001E275323|nr:uncharacterized protein LOC123676012 isoform X1 [Harmonia axyridis]XP_045467602.1 uncharacterized protein LOC123676012 isoform X1 [Harmonia axyridis]